MRGSNGGTNRTVADATADPPAGDAALSDSHIDSGFMKRCSHSRTNLESETGDGENCLLSTNTRSPFDGRSAEYARNPSKVVPLSPRERARVRG